MRSRRLSMAVAAFWVLAFLGFDLSSAQEPATESVPIWEYTLPVSPTNLVVVPAGDVWFSAFNANAIGKLEVSTGQVLLYNRSPGLNGNVWGIKRDSAGRIWYSIGNDDTGVGRLDPSTGQFVEWRVPGHHVGLDVNEATGDLLFVTTGGAVATGIYVLSPSTNHVSSWQFGGYENLHDLAIAPNGAIWFTVQPGANQGVGRLDPTTGQVTVWALPVAASRPFRVIIQGNDSIWFTEYAPDANNIAHLTPSTNTLDEYKVPTAISNPWGLLMVNGKFWFTEKTGNKIGRLDPAQATPTTTILSPTTLTAFQGDLLEIEPNPIPVTRVATTATVINASATKTVTGGFTEFALPTAASGPAGIVFGPPDRLWFGESGTNRLGRMATGDVVIRSLFLPLVLKGQ